MKAQHLRIMNWVNHCDLGDGQVSAHDIENLQFYAKKHSHEYKPIPLTEEWLVKFGFVSDPYQDMYIKGWLKINCDKTKGKLELWVENITGKVVYLNYVHQLQNLFHALTNEELTIKQ